MKKLKECIPHFRMPSLMVVILTQYLLTITSAIVSLMLWYVRGGDSSITTCLLQILIALSSNCCSVACTLSFISRDDEDKAFQPKRTIIIVISLVVNLILSILISSGLVTLDESQHWKLLIPLGTLTILLVCWLVILQRKVEKKNADRTRRLSPEQKDTIMNSRGLKITDVDGQEMNFEESEDENQSTRNKAEQ